MRLGLSRCAHMGESAAPSWQHATEDGWPRLHGIDLDLARSRLIGDLCLFTSSLRRLLSEFADLEERVPTQQMQLTATYAQRMHKLKGTAGMLGAAVIEQLASGAEAACRSASLDKASSLGRQIGVEIQLLRHSAANVLAAGPPRGDAMLSGAEREPIDAASLAKLVDLLRAQDLAALDQFNSMAKSLRRHLGPQAFETVCNFVDQLRLTEAAAALREFQP